MLSACAALPGSLAPRVPATRNPGPAISCSWNLAARRRRAVMMARPAASASAACSARPPLVCSAAHRDASTESAQHQAAPAGFVSPLVHVVQAACTALNVLRLQQRYNRLQQQKRRLQQRLDGQMRACVDLQLQLDAKVAACADTCAALTALQHSLLLAGAQRDAARAERLVAYADGVVAWHSAAFEPGEGGLWRHGLGRACCFRFYEHALSLASSCTCIHHACIHPPAGPPSPRLVEGMRSDLACLGGAYAEARAVHKLLMEQYASCWDAELERYVQQAAVAVDAVRAGHQALDLLLLQAHIALELQHLAAVKAMVAAVAAVPPAVARDERGMLLLALVGPNALSYSLKHTREQTWYRRLLAWRACVMTARDSWLHQAHPFGEAWAPPAGLDAEVQRQAAEIDARLARMKAVEQELSDAIGTAFEALDTARKSKQRLSAAKHKKAMAAVEAACTSAAKAKAACSSAASPNPIFMPRQRRLLLPAIVAAVFFQLWWPLALLLLLLVLPR